MASYNIRFTILVQKELGKIPKKDQSRILKRINSLASNPRPHGYKKLINYNGYRIRQGDYRIVYTIHDKELLVWIIEIDNRKDIYRVSEEKAEYSAGKKTGESFRNKTGKTKRLP